MLRHRTVAGLFTHWSMQCSAGANLKPRSREPPQAPRACPSHAAGPRPGQRPRGVTFGSKDLWGGQRSAGLEDSGVRSFLSQEARPPFFLFHPALPLSLLFDIQTRTHTADCLFVLFFPHWFRLSTTGSHKTYRSELKIMRRLLKKKKRERDRESAI